MEPVERSWLSQVRALVPARELDAEEVPYLLERQATRLLDLSGTAGPPVPVFEIAPAMPHVIVRRATNLNVSGRTQWIGRAWVIQLARDEPLVRQRFTLGHEIAHVVMHPVEATCLPATAGQSHAQRLEAACDSFAACLLMPRVWLKRAYFAEAIQTVPELARLFDVSYTAMRRRLDDLGIKPRR